MVTVEMTGSPAVGPRGGLLIAACAFLLDGNPLGNAHRPLVRPWSGPHAQNSEEAVTGDEN